MVNEGYKVWKPDAAVVKSGGASSEAQVYGYNAGLGRLRRVREAQAIDGQLAAEANVDTLRRQIAGLSGSDKDAIWGAIEGGSRPHEERIVKAIAGRIGITAMALIREFPLAVVEL